MPLITAQFLLEDTPQLDEFNEWYSTKHVADFVKAPGVVGGRRFYRRENGRIRFVAMYEHDGSVRPRESFESPEGAYAISDFKERFPDLPMPEIQVFHEIVVGPDYTHWRRDHR